MPQHDKRGDAHPSKLTTNLTRTGGSSRVRTSEPHPRRITGTDRILIKMLGRHWPDASTALVVGRSEAKVQHYLAFTRSDKSSWVSEPEWRVTKRWLCQQVRRQGAIDIDAPTVPKPPTPQDWHGVVIRQSYLYASRSGEFSELPLLPIKARGRLVKMPFQILGKQLGLWIEVA